MPKLLESEIYEFGDFSLDAKSHRLFRGASRELVPLTPKATEVLIALVRAAGRVVLKDELLDTVWGGAFVEDANLSQSVFLLRKALHEDKKNPKFILTLPNRGYQFIGAVTGADSEDDILNESFLNEGGPRATRGLTPDITGRRSNLLLLTVPVLLFLSFGVYWFYPAAQPAKLTEIKTIAVLPFKDLSAGQTDKYLGVSLADALVNKFTDLAGITVRPTRTVLKYAESRDNVGKIGRELQVDAVLDGLIQRDGDRVRVSVQLVRTSDNATIWTENFDDKFTNFFTVQDSISQKVVGSLALQIDDKERQRLNRRGTENADAYQDYLHGRFFWNKRTRTDIQRAMDYFDHAILKDRNFALAYGGLADCYAMMPEYMAIPASEAYPRAKEYAKKALELDEQLAEVHTTLGYVHEHSLEPVEAEKSFKRAIELNPNYVRARHWYARFLREANRLDEALTEMKRATEIDPVSVALMVNTAQVYKKQGNYDLAIDQLTKALTFEPDNAITHDELARVYLKKGLYDAALVESQKAVDLSDGSHTLLVTRAEVLIASGKRAEAQTVIRQLETKYSQGSSYYIAYLYAQLKERQRALDWLEKAIAEKHMDLIDLKDDPSFDPYRRDPRFQELASRVGAL